MALTEHPHGSPFDRNTSRLVQIRCQLLVGPIRAIEPTPLGPCLHPLLNGGHQRLGNPTSLSRSPVDLDALHTLFGILLEPQAHRRTMYPQILGDGLALPPAMGHDDRLAPVAESTIIGRFEELFQACLFRCCQSDAPHLCSSPLMKNPIRGYLKKDANSSDACIRVRLVRLCLVCLCLASIVGSGGPH